MSSAYEQMQRRLAQQSQATTAAFKREIAKAPKQVPVIRSPQFAEVVRCVSEGRLGQIAQPRNAQQHAKQYKWERRSDLRPRSAWASVTQINRK